METQLKQRLTGAILLVVIAVLVVPELLTGPREPAAAAPMVNDAAPIRSYTIDLTGATPPRVTRPPGEPPAAAPAAPRAAAGAPAAATVAPGAAAGNADGRPSPLPLPASRAPAAATPPAAAAPGTAALASGAPMAAPTPTPAPAPTAAATPATAGAGSAAQSFAVQLGSYANRDTVTKLTASLRSAGFKVSVVQVRAGGKELQRVRVGPVSNRAAAEALQSRLAAAGHKGPVVPFP